MARICKEACGRLHTILMVRGMDVPARSRRANQLSVYGTVADLCKEQSEDSESSGKPEAPDYFGDDGNSCCHPIPTNSNRETWCKTVSENSNNCPMTRNYPNCALMRV